MPSPTISSDSSFPLLLIETAPLELGAEVGSEVGLGGPRQDNRSYLEQLTALSDSGKGVAAWAANSQKTKSSSVVYVPSVVRGAPERA